MFRLLLVIMLFSTTAGHAQSSLSEWRGEGARPAMVAAFSVSVDDYNANRQALGQLLTAIDRQTVMTLANGNEITVTPRSSDIDLLKLVSGPIDLKMIYNTDKQLFIQLAMLSDITWNRLRNFVASRLWEIKNSDFKQQIEFGILSDPGIILMPELEQKAFKLIIAQASGLVSNKNNGVPKPETFDWLMPDCASTGLC